MEPEEALEGFETSSGSVSHTMSIKTIKEPSLGSFVLMDTPGFKDNRGPEIDIANAICISQALSQCQSVRFLLLINYHELRTDRGQGLRETLDIVLKFIVSEEVLRSVTVILLRLHAC